jgi:hypothetical protein
MAMPEGRVFVARADRMKRFLLGLMAGLLVATNTNAQAASAKDSPEPVLREFLVALYSNDKPAYLKTVFDPMGADSLVGTQPVTAEQIEAVRHEAEGAQLRQSTAFTFEGKPVASAPYPTGTKATYMTAFRGSNLAIPVILGADGWRVDVRFWLEMQKMRKENITEADPRIVAKKFVFYELSNNLDKLNSVSLTPVTGDQVGIPNGLPGGDLDQVLSLCIEMPVVHARPGETFMSPSGQRLRQGEKAGDEVYIALMGPVELPIVLRKQGTEWKVVPENYFRLLRSASAL